MATNSQRSYFCLVMSDGTASLACMPNKALDPRVSLTEQLDKCVWLDNMPANEMAELGASLVTAAVGAMRAYAERVRTMKVRGLVANEVIQPADPQELAKIATFMEGINLDPTSGLKDIQNHLNKKEADEAAAEES